MTTVPQRWRKSSYSNDSSDCVEVGSTLNAVRDSKNPDGPVLSIAGFAAFVCDVKSGRIAN